MLYFWIEAAAAWRGDRTTLDARPRDRDSGFERIRLGMGRDGVEAMELYDHFGQTTVLQFSRFARNPRLSPDDFRFTPPKGADVLGE